MFNISIHLAQHDFNVLVLQKVQHPKSDIDTDVTSYFIMNVTVQDGEKSCTKAAVKLAFKAVFVHDFTSDGHPMLLEWLQTFKKIAVLNSY